MTINMRDGLSRAQAALELVGNFVLHVYNCIKHLGLSQGLLREDMSFMLLRADNLMLLLISTIWPGTIYLVIPYMLISHLLTKQA